MTVFAAALAERDAAAQECRAIKRGRGRPAGTDFFARNPEFADAVEAILSQRQVSASVVLELLEAHFGAARCPNLRSLQRFVQRFESEKAVVLQSLRDPDGFKSRHRLALGRADQDAPHAHAVWEIDTTKADVLTSDGGRVGILLIVDRYSRRARMGVVPSESGQSVRRFLAETMTAWKAVPFALATDNGSGYVNKSVVSALPMLAIEHIRCAPGAPETKPFVERMFGTATRQRLRLLKGFTGHNVAEGARLRAKAKKQTGRQVIDAGCTAAELHDILTGYVEGVYNQRKHGVTGQSPLARMLACPVPPRAVPSPDVLRVALSDLIGERTVTKRGLVWQGGSYWHEALTTQMGRTVQVRRDEDELGELMVFDANGRFVCTAVNHTRTGTSEAEWATAQRRRQNAIMADQRAELRDKQRAYDIDTFVQSRLREDAIKAGRVTELPKRAQPHSTPALDAIIGPAPASAPAPVITQTDRDRLEVAVRRAPAFGTLATPDKVAFTDRVIRAAETGEAVDEAELRTARLFAASTEYRAEKAVALHFTPRRADTGTDDLITLGVTA